MGNDLYPRFSDREMTHRRRTMFATIEDAGVSHLIVYGADRSGTAIPWLTEWPTTQEAALLLTPGERPHLWSSTTTISPMPEPSPKTVWWIGVGRPRSIGSRSYSGPDTRPGRGSV
jgi:hypothetical protein